MPICAVSIDVDSIPCYYRIHGLGTPPRELRHVIMQQCIPRFAEIFARRGISATFFVIAGDLDPERAGPGADDCRRLVAELSAAGHEIGNHSYSHRYDLARLPQHQVAAEIGHAHKLLCATAGEVVGFRAPGYDISAVMMAELVRRGYRYDSSIFPAWGYYAAKAVVMAGLALAGQPSGAVFTDPRALLAPCDPYHPTIRAPWRRGHAPIIEIPIGVTPGTRMPVIGTFMTTAPLWMRVCAIDAMLRRPVFNFELHGIDLADADLDGIPGELVAKQPDLRIPLAHKLRRLEAALDRIALDCTFVPLRSIDAVERRGRRHLRGRRY